MADIFARRRTLPPYKDKDGNALSPRDRALARVEVLLREDLSPPADEDVGPTVEPCPVNPEEAAEIVRLSPPARPPAPLVRAGAPKPKPSAPVPPAAPSSPPLKTSFFHVLLQILILLFVLSWVFIVGIVVGRGHLWESGPVYDLVIWLEEKVGWEKAEEPPLVFVKESPDEADDEINWEDVRRQYGYSDELPETGGRGYPDDPAEVDADRLANSQWLSAAPALLNYDGPASGYQGPGDPPPDEESSEGADGPAMDAVPAADSARAVEPAPVVDSAPAAEPVQTVDSTPAPLPRPVAEETKIAPDTPVDAGEGRYAVQVASPYEESEAQRRVARLLSQSFPAYYYRTSSGRYPVRVGRFVTRAEADEAKRRLDSLGYTGHYISVLSN